jgi:hypothetical protein
MLTLLTRSRATVLKFGFAFGLLSAMLGSTVITAGAAPRSPRSPQYVQCSSHVVSTQASRSQNYTGIGTVYVFFEKLVDARNFAFGGSVRNHARVVISGTHSGHLSGVGHFGHDYQHLGGSILNTDVVGSSGTLDSWGAVGRTALWVSGRGFYDRQRGLPFTYPTRLRRLM